MIIDVEPTDASTIADLANQKENLIDTQSVQLTWIANASTLSGQLSPSTSVAFTSPNLIFVYGDETENNCIKLGVKATAFSYNSTSKVYTYTLSCDVPPIADTVISVIFIIY